MTRYMGDKTVQYSSGLKNAYYRKVLFLVYPNIDIDYIDGEGNPNHLKYTLPQSEIDKAV